MQRFKSPREHFLYFAVTVAASMSLQRMPASGLVTLSTADNISRIMFSVSAVTMFIITLLLESHFAASEKYMGINILMALNGVPFHTNLCSWLISGIVYGAFYVTIVIIVMTKAFANPILFYGNAFIIWVFLIFHLTHLITLGMHVAAYFSRFSIMATGIFIIYGGSSLFQAYLIESNIYSIIPFLGIIFPNILLYRMFEEMNLYEAQVVGVHWSNIYRVADSYYSAAGSVGVMIIFSIMGAALHFFLALYVYSIFPGKFGVRQHPLYFLQNKGQVYKELDEELDEFSYGNVVGKPFEAVPKGVFTPGIQIRNLTKFYSTDWLNHTIHEALHSVSVDFHKGQITTVLGLNGAGKSTMLSILTGLRSPTEGAVLIDGKRVCDFFNSFATNLSFCPQENMFFSSLTVLEQVELFGLLKSFHKADSDSKLLSFNASALLKRLKLFEKRNCFPKELCGCQKRQLCLGMALIGDAKTLILDEPTCGMDPESRRGTWDMLLEMRGEKTILISTHDMEEADRLGDRIAIMHMGRLKSYGTPTFLKKLYGQGNIEITVCITTWCDPDKIRNELGPNSQLLKLEDGKIVLCAPHTDQLAETLDKLEHMKRDFGITGINVTHITLEQVFLKVTKEEENIDLDRPFPKLSHKSTGRELLLQSIVALLEKNFTNARKNMSTYVIIMVLPLISILLMILDFSSLNETKPLMPISLKMYSNPQAFFSSNDESVGEKYKMVVESLNGVANKVDANNNVNDALLASAEKDFAQFRHNVITAAEFNVTQKSVNANALYSATALLSIPISVNLISNAFLKASAGDDYSIDISDHRFPKIRQFSDYNLSGLCLLLNCFLYMAMAFYVVNPLTEASSGMKHLQKTTGVTSYVYWGTQFFFDFIVFIVSMIVWLIAFYCLDIVADLQLYRAAELSVNALLLTLFAANALPIAYIFSFVKRSKSTVISILGLLPLILLAVEGLLWVIEWETYAFNPNAANSTEADKAVAYIDFRAVQKKVFMLIPHISFFHGQVSFLLIGSINAHCRYTSRFVIKNTYVEDFCAELECSNGTCNKHIPYFGTKKQFSEAEATLSETVTYMSLTPIMYFGILLLLEYRLIQSLFAKLLSKHPKENVGETDDQIREEKYSVGFEISKLKSERSSIKNQDNKLMPEAKLDSDSTLLVHELSKYYKSKSAVSDVSFSVKPGECFGLLGVNGSGKSTTFRMLTGDEVPDRGEIYLGGQSIHTERSDYLSQMGYCPQNAVLIEPLNARDHLRLFAQLRGVPKDQVDSEVKEWIDRLNLNDCSSRPCGTYSDGNKRRLNIAIAFIGRPNLVLLDEPTTKIDPASRRSLWNMIKSFLESGQSIILTSHSMEECEALCSRLVIMVEGRLLCIGSSQELKQRFGAGYNINVELSPGRAQAEIEGIKKDIENALNCEIRDEHTGCITYHVTNSKTPWKTMYEVMNRLKHKYSTCIVDFTILSATLEQLFLQFTKIDND